MKTKRKTKRALTPVALAMALILGLFSSNCDKVEPERLILIKTGGFSEVTQTSCLMNGTLFDVGTGDGVDQHGFCWSTTSNLNNMEGCIELGPRGEKGNYSGPITGLIPGTSYYVWAYASQGDFRKYGESLNFETLAAVSPSISTGAVSEITDQTAHCGGLVLSDGGAEITEKGVCWNTSPGPTTEDFHAVDNSGMAEFGIDLTELTPNTTYYIRAYATNSVGTGYGNEFSFKTLTGQLPPEVTTTPVEEINWNSAVGGGNITSTGGSEVTERGICWNLDPNPVISDFSASSGAGLGEFNVLMTGLSPETEYFVRAYAINNLDVVYGNEQVFTTAPAPLAPQLVTGDVEGIEASGVTISGSSIISDGGAPIESKGLCWSTSPNPTLLDENLEYGNGPDPFTMEIQGLIHNTEYYIRAYATNNEGLTGYGDQKVFRTLFLCGSVLFDERDMREYGTVQISEQCWMSQNLNVGMVIDTSAKQTENGSIEKYCYDNNPANCDIYGGMYSWDEMMQYTTEEMVQGVCPAGWHLPSDAEWKTLEMFLGMSQASADSLGWRGYNNEGGKLKSTETPPWNEPNLGATNASQFSALPSGMVWHNGPSVGIGDYAVFWTSTPGTEEYAVYRFLHTDDTRIDREEGGFRPNTTPVRCLKD